MTAAPPGVLLLTDTLQLGGTEGQYAVIACGLDPQTWALDAACLRAEGPLRPTLERAGVRPWSCGSGTFKSPRAARAIWRLAAHLRSRRIRVIHSFDFYSNVLGVLAGRLAGLPGVIASQRDLGDVRRPTQRRLHRAILRMATRVVVNSPAVAERLHADRTVAPTRIVLIPNGVDTDRFAPAPRAERTSALTVTTLANLRPEKGIADLIGAAARVRDAYPDIRFTIWGDGPLRSELAALIERLSLRGTVELRGHTTMPEAVLRESDIFVLPSLSEACSNGLLEAMATGLPVVATRVGGNAVTIEDQATGLLVPPSEPDTLAKAIIRLIENPELGGALGARGREHVLNEFSVARMLARVDALYRDELARNAR